MIFRCFSMVFLIFLFGIHTSSSAPVTSDQESQSQLDKFAAILQRIQEMAAGMPQITNMTQQALTQLEQFRGSALFFANPCSFFQSIFRTFYCTISSFDPQRSNPAVQGLLQFLNANNMFFNFASNFFCPFAAFGGGGNAGSTPGSTAGGSGAGINCAAGATGPGTSGFTSNLDDPSVFVGL